LSDNIDAKLKLLPKKALKQIRALAKGNGVEQDSIQIKSAKGEVIHCQAINHLELHPDIIEEKKKGRVQAGQVLPDPAQVKKAVNDMVTGAIKNDETRKYLAKILLDRPDKGFALHAEYFETPPLNRDFCWHEPCPTCEGHGNVACSRCGGGRREVCPKCHGRTMIPCTFCHASGFIKGPDGKQHQCNRCFGQRQITCPLCQKTGSVPCQQCKGSGTNQCNACKGAAFFTNITHIVMKMKTLFEIDRAALPHPAVKVIEDSGWKMVEHGHIKLHAEQVKREDGGLAIQYDTEFPYGDLELSMNGKPLKTHLFGFKGKMLKLPNFVDTITEQNFKLLEDAAMHSKNAASKIRKASKTRLISEALLLSISMPPKKAMYSLKRKYPMGASNDLIKNAVMLSNKALANVTRKTRFGGQGLGMFLSALIDGAYLMTPMRGMIDSIHPYAAVAGDILLIALGGFIGNKAVAYMAKRPLRSALGASMPQTQRGKFKPKAQGNIWIAYVFSALVMAIMIFVAKQTGASVPFWFPF